MLKNLHIVDFIDWMQNNQGWISSVSTLAAARECEVRDRQTIELHMWPLGDMKGAGPHSQRNWPSLTTTEQAGITYRRYPRDISQLCYKCYSGQATCSSVNKTSHPASAVRYHLSKRHRFPLMTVMARHLSVVPSPLFIHSHIRGYLTQHTSWKMNLVMCPKACLWFY